MGTILLASKKGPTSGPSTYKGAALYTFTSKIRYSEIDETGRLSVPAAINYLQDASTFHAEDVGQGLEQARATGTAWMLAAWRIEIRKLPAMGESICVRTWPTGCKGLFSNRNFTIHTADAAADEEPCLRADSIWFLYDTAAGRPRRIGEEHLAAFADQDGFEAALDMDAAQRRIHLPKGAVAIDAEPVRVATTHIDTNHHVNNAQYVGMAIDALLEYPPAQRAREALANRSDDSPITIDVQYSSAATRGQTIYPHIYQDAAGFIVSLDDLDGAHFAIVSISQA